MEERRLAAAGRAHHGDELPRLDRRGDAVDGSHLGRSGSERLDDIAEFDDGGDVHDWSFPDVTSAGGGTGLVQTGFTEIEPTEVGLGADDERIGHEAGGQRLGVDHVDRLLRGDDAGARRTGRCAGG